jgi:ubiquinone/menaquinone biosynthesis C-methylase UbiE/acyl carrier protein
MDGSYKLESFTDNIESEVNRLKYQVDLFYQKEIELYKKIGLRDGMKIIECGSGPGFLIRNIVRDLPNCIATAVEIDPYLVGQLNKNSVINNKKLFEVKHASIIETELPDNYFDFAIARLVLEHLNEPEIAIAELSRILKPGGKLVLVSNDFAYHLLTYPPIPELDEMYRAYIESRTSEGGNPLIGRQLPVLLKKGMFETINIEIICVHSDMEGDKSFLKAENVNISKSLVKDGFLKKEILESLIENWYKMLQQPDHILFRQLFVISGTKGTKTAMEYGNTHKNDSAITDSQSLNVDSLMGMTPTEQESALGSYFISKVQTIMEQQNMELGLHTKLNDIDIDSISAAELSSIVKSDFNTSISISDILQKLTVNNIIKLILNNLKSYSSVKPDGLDTEAAGNWLEGEL